MREPSSFEPPTQFEEYEVLRLLGEGAMGKVYLARDTLLERDVAIKFTRRHRDVVARQRFLTEARAAARVSHANVVKVYRVGELDDHPFIVSEFVRGRSLNTLTKPQPWRNVLSIARDIARGLAAAHRHGVLHRDVKPANAVQLDDGRVVLLDFGLAKVARTNSPACIAVDAEPIPSELLVGDETLAPLSVDDSLSDGYESSESSPSLTRDGAVLGTPRYMAPEVRNGADASAAADVFSLGALVFELLSGAPFSKPTSAPIFESLAASTEATFIAAIQKCLVTNPAGRYPSAERFSSSLERISRDLEQGSDQARLLENPYRGLLAFDVEHAGLFFGRQAQVWEALERLKSNGFLVVAGDSGVGKSSFCRAGLLAQISSGALADGRKWSVIDVACGRDPHQLLIRALQAPAQDDQAVRDEGTLDPTVLVHEQRKRLGKNKGLVVHLDQLEELITVAEENSAKEATILLAELATPSPNIKVVASIRGDYLARVGSMEPLASLFSRGLFLLRPMGRDERRECVTGPAIASGASFDSEATIDLLVDAVGDDPAALPLLQFTLQRLWDGRDKRSGEIGREQLDALGGVGGALAQHADSIYLGMGEARRLAAQKILVSLVTSDRTRVSRSRSSLPGDPESRDAALDALVDGRLLGVRVSEAPTDDSLVELAHETLAHSWDRLRGWLDNKDVKRIAADRIDEASRRWIRRGRRKEEQLRGSQLREARAIAPTDMGEDARALVQASHRAHRLRQLIALTSFLVVVGVVVAAWATSRARSQRALDRDVETKLAISDESVEAARTHLAKLKSLRAASFTAFDKGDPAAESVWQQALEQSREVRRAFADATPPLEAALSIAPRRIDVRDRLASWLFERALVSELLGDETTTTELLARLRVYDTREMFSDGWTAPATVIVQSSPENARVFLTRFSATDNRPLEASFELIGSAQLAPGSYLIRATASGHATTTLAVKISRRQHATFSLRLPPARSVPKGFVFIPNGDFLYGTGEGEAQRSFYEASPLHKRSTEAYLIALHETTIGEWIEFLETLDPDERTARSPRAVGRFRGAISVGKEGLRWRIRYSPSEIEYEAVDGQAIVYAERTKRESQDWYRFPVTGISVADVGAYAKWLDSSKRVPRARLCGEDEWERAVKGADERRFATGNQLGAEDANIDLTYGRRVGGYGLDEIGSYPNSISPYGLFDTAGNAFEMTNPLGGEGLVARGGAYYFRSNTAVAANRAAFPEQGRDLTLGFRLCADLENQGY